MVNENCEHMSLKEIPKEKHSNMCLLRAGGTACRQAGRQASSAPPPSVPEALDLGGTTCLALLV